MCMLKWLRVIATKCISSIIHNGPPDIGNLFSIVQADFLAPNWSVRTSAAPEMTEKLTMMFSILADFQ